MFQSNKVWNIMLLEFFSHSQQGNVQVQCQMYTESTSHPSWGDNATSPTSHNQLNDLLILKYTAWQGINHCQLRKRYKSMKQACSSDTKSHIFTIKLLHQYVYYIQGIKNLHYMLEK